MQKSYFHKNKSTSKSKGLKINIPLQYIDQKRVVDINRLLNRVRIEKKNKTKREIIFYSSITLALGFFLNLVITIN